MKALCWTKLAERNAAYVVSTVRRGGREGKGAREASAQGVVVALIALARHVGGVEGERFVGCTERFGRQQPEDACAALNAD